jgi:hypothetical protein
MIKTKNKVIVKLKGGLGNQMFQYAAGRIIALNNNMPLWLDIGSFKLDTAYNRKYCLDYLNIKPDKVINNIYTRVVFFRSFNIKIFDSNIYIDEPVLYNTNEEYLLRLKKGLPVNSYTNKVLISKYSKTVIVDGYWQSDKYFSNIKKEITEEFKFTRKLSNKKRKLLYSIMSKNSVCIGIRQFNESKESQVHYKLNAKYYRKAIDYLSDKINNPHFYIFTLDKDWALRNIKSEFPITIIGTDNSKMSIFEDLYLMSQCNHFIISNSTYHWWGAWLAEYQRKIIIAPKLGWSNNHPVSKTWIKI